MDLKTLEVVIDLYNDRSTGKKEAQLIIIGLPNYSIKNTE
ncbi:hypothetical protein Xvie_02684 [Xenorhabdus vietnamensis]|uniref:Uncharacterized protein n=1 Tax=Xenorhabdus vietnamensis TaxID=351656 RepID=A0A1Y2SDJ0_9GAMM|nr:hypothetical protein Xvie_02684 [Xenorhabdus vietnamensis]